MVMRMLVDFYNNWIPVLLWDYGIVKWVVWKEEIVLFIK